jgi:hypothetical protein
MSHAPAYKSGKPKRVPNHFIPILNPKKQNIYSISLIVLPKRACVSKQAPYRRLYILLPALSHVSLPLYTNMARIQRDEKKLTLSKCEQ